LAAVLHITTVKPNWAISTFGDFYFFALSYVLDIALSIWLGFKALSCLVKKIAYGISSVPSKIFVSRLVSKKCRQDQKKLRPKMRPFLPKKLFINHF